ncbi:MAG: periplasmic heavy metal sensor [Alphaproteobacteria bacterium]|nr:periplasmic heavy metal sensor [Reyranella sp.]MBL6940058.1 periplasmic heavy metal sensor [Alphaproteobacteria bacterium]MBL7100145.1 periplasmic heavy metal sensor [Alphaproteobacteria bacterium]
MMSRTFLFMLLLTILAAGLAGWAGVQYGLSRSADSTDLDTVLHRDLALSAEQERRIGQLEEKFGTERGVLQEEMRAANDDLARAITEERIYGPKAQRAIGRFHSAMAALQEKTVRHILAMRAVLTPDQARRFDTTITKALGSGAP